MLTNEQIQHYLENSDQCPICYSSDLTGESFQSDIGTAWQPITCRTCKAEWVDAYTLTGVEDPL